MWYVFSFTITASVEIQPYHTTKIDFKMIGVRVFLCVRRFHGRGLGMLWRRGAWRDTLTPPMSYSRREEIDIHFHLVFLPLPASTMELSHSSLTLPSSRSNVLGLGGRLLRGVGSSSAPHHGDRAQPRTPHLHKHHREASLYWSFKPFLYDALL